MDLRLLNEKMKVDMLFHLAHLSFRLELDFWSIFIIMALLPLILSKKRFWHFDVNLREDFKSNLLSVKE